MDFAEMKVCYGKKIKMVIPIFKSQYDNFYNGK